MANVMTRSKAADKKASSARLGSSAAPLDIMGSAMKQPMLSREEEQRLARAWKDHGCLASRDLLITSHLKLSVKLAYKRAGDDKEYIKDLVQESVFSLMHALDKFDPDLGNRFSTYARNWIQAKIQNEIMSNASVVLIKKTSKNRQSFYTYPGVKNQAEINLRKKGMSPNVGEIAIEAARMVGVSASEFVGIDNAVPRTSSLNTLIGKGDDQIEGIELLADEAPGPEQFCITQDSQSRAVNVIARALEGLTDRERYIIQMRKMAIEPLTLFELAETFNVTSERIRQIEVKALKRLKSLLSKQGIRDLSFLAD